MDPHILLRDGAQAVENIPQKVKQSYHISQEFHMWVHQFSCSVQSDSLRPHESQQARPKRNENIHPSGTCAQFHHHKMLGQLIFISSACVWLLADITEGKKKSLLPEWGMEGVWGPMNMYIMY